MVRRGLVGAARCCKGPMLVSVNAFGVVGCVWLGSAPAGFNTPGEPLPSYLLDRPAGSTRCSTTGFDPELPSYVHLEALRARFAPYQAALDGSEEAAEADECWLTEHLPTCVRWRGARGCTLRRAHQ